MISGQNIRERRKHTVTSLISSSAIACFLLGTEVLEVKLKICIQGRQRSQRQVRANKTKTRAEKTESIVFKASVQVEICCVLPVQMLRLVGQRSEESQRVLGWSGWWGSLLIWLEVGLEGGPAEGRKDGVTGRWGG